MFWNNSKNSYKATLFQRRRFRVCLHLWGHPLVCLGWELTNVSQSLHGLRGATECQPPVGYRQGRLLSCPMAYRRWLRMWGDN